jgi:hypothetical protein
MEWRVAKSLPLQDYFHSYAQESGCVSVGSVGWMNRNLDVRTKLNALSQTKPVKRFKYAFTMYACVGRVGVVEGNAEHVSSTSEGMNLRQPYGIGLLD